jgi:hypothetical protein
VIDLSVFDPGAGESRRHPARAVRDRRQVRPDREPASTTVGAAGTDLDHRFPTTTPVVPTTAPPGRRRPRRHLP